MKIKEGFALRQVGDNHIVVPVGAQTLDFRCIITLNDSGAFLWQLLQDENTVDGLVEAILEEYEVEESVARTDIEKFVAALKESDLLA